MTEVPYNVSYNGLKPWGSGVPYVSMDVEEVFAAGQVGFIRTITLNGTVPTGQVDIITGIRTAFASNFKEFIAPNVRIPCSLVQEVSFGSQNYIGKVDYSITLKDFSGFIYGVNNPIDEVSFQEETDGSITVSRKISAVGICTDLNTETALNNAKNFVYARTGIDTLALIGTSFISTGNSGNIFLLSQQENINRLTNTYSIDETFKYDPLYNTTSGTFKRFSVDFSSGINDDYLQVSVNGTYTISKNDWNDNLLSQVNADELYALATGVCSNLNSKPASFSVDTDETSQTSSSTPYAKILNVRAIYDTSPMGSYFEYDVDGSKDYKLGISEINVRGVIIGSGRHVRKKFENALSYFNNTVGGWNGTKTFLYNTAVSGATDFGYTAFPLNTTPKTRGVVFNSGQGSIVLTASFDDAPFVDGYSDFSWSVSTDCGLNVFQPFASTNLNGTYLIQDLNILNRTNVTLNGNFAYPNTGSFNLTKAKNILVLLKELEGVQNAYIESESYNNSSGDVMATGFNYSYSKDGRNLTNIPSDGKIYVGITI